MQTPHQIQLDNFKNSFDRLVEVLERNIEDDDIVLDATIQRFEFTFENSWKTIKLVLKDQGIECLSPRECIKQAFRYGWILDEDTFLNLLEARNLTSHTYAKPIALTVYRTIKQNASAFEYLYKKIRELYL
ncbi:MAG: nucleotidyltransferase [Candidatus Margulisiibacteriota bacterium]|nr:MAG: hypothetical protein A2X43_05795 [Candidatus Margulisbacteria bacterium GWD2_39_127]OGI01065.1 MAG: hypothetical protein A2X42_12435 [Candidatus Margulisbacteria bacterium GWF2_38_17]OGI09594.1 MAG: hypothetical protein A2X41_06640 [Candidatus Margulisbacteria bacterium GWE2_39_32]PZM82041.1 MAG: nucleotidyltransferase [Candidatus Margulisiibacteriota bacterium]HCT84095.1 nucleotidyltransferase [Candidatus Margulisiibacteriota bacterium]